MRPLVTSLVLFSLLATPAFPANRYVDAGYPGTEVRWTGKDYARAAELMLNNKDLPLPTLSDADSAPIFQRMADPANLAILENKKVSVTARFLFLLEIDKQLARVMGAYADRVDRDEKLGEELVRLFALALHNSKQGVLLAEEFLPQMPKDNTYETRRAALKKLKEGISRQFSFGEETLSESTHFTADNRSTTLTAMRDTLPVAKRAFTATFRHELRGKFAQRLKDAERPKDRELLQEIVSELQYGADSVIEFL